MTEFVIILVGLVVGFVLGWRLRELHAQRILNAMFKNMEREQQSKAEDIMHIDIEKNNDCFYVYNADSKAFIVQVKNKEELFEYISNKFPNKNVMIRKEHFALFDTL